MAPQLIFTADPAELADVSTLMLLGRKARLAEQDVMAQLPDSVTQSIFLEMLQGEAGDNGRLASTFTGARPRRLVVGVLPEPCSRYNAPSRAWAIPGLVQGAGRQGSLGIVAALEHASHAFAVATSIARALPTFSAKGKDNDRQVTVLLLGPEGPVTRLDRLHHAAHGVREAARLVDTPPNRLDVAGFVSEAREVAASLDGVRLRVIEGDEVLAEGLGGLWGVGKAATVGPAMVVLDHEPPGALEHHCWVGKGIVYDTGGLSLKTKTGMPGMKNDMGGAAAVLEGFAAAVRAGCPHNLTAVLCLAENAIGPDATRPDDILEMKSGRTVEINNTDAEGRLVLADGIAWVLANRRATTLLDLATLTGAQMMATGKLMAGVVSSDGELEARTVAAGRSSGELVHPLPYLPELLRKEFSSAIADMKNSVKDRNNAQSSCAAQFVSNHRGNSQVPWLHVDMAGPVMRGGRGTGYGVALLMTLADVGA